VRLRSEVGDRGSNFKQDKRVIMAPVTRGVPAEIRATPSLQTLKIRPSATSSDHLGGLGVMQRRQKYAAQWQVNDAEEEGGDEPRQEGSNHSCERGRTTTRKKRKARGQHLAIRALETFLTKIRVSIRQKCAEGVRVGQKEQMHSLNEAREGAPVHAADRLRQLAGSSKASLTNAKNNGGTMR